MSYLLAVARLFDLQSSRACPVQFPSGRGILNARLGMHFKIVSGTEIEEFIERCDSAVAAFDRVRALIRSNAPNIRILDEGGRRYSLTEIEELAEDEADGV